HTKEEQCNWTSPLKTLRLLWETEMQRAPGKQPDAQEHQSPTNGNRRIRCIGQQGPPAAHYDSAHDAKHEEKAQCHDETEAKSTRKPSPYTEMSKGVFISTEIIPHEGRQHDKAARIDGGKQARDQGKAQGRRTHGCTCLTACAI